MATPAQIAANRANAALSTGPRSDAGKARSSLNGLRRGLCARDVVLPGEDRATFDAMRAELFAEFAPQGRYETLLVERLTDTSGRLGRSAAIEAGLLSPDWEGGPEGLPRVDAGPLVDTFRVALDNAETLDKLGRHEARLARVFDTTAQLLERHQRQRRRRAGKGRGK